VFRRLGFRAVLSAAGVALLLALTPASGLANSTDPPPGGDLSCQPLATGYVTGNTIHIIGYSSCYIGTTVLLSLGTTRPDNGQNIDTRPKSCPAGPNQVSCTAAGVSLDMVDNSPGLQSWCASTTIQWITAAGRLHIEHGIAWCVSH
jgi:hypothetical protein